MINVKGDSADNLDINHTLDTMSSLQCINIRSFILLILWKWFCSKSGNSIATLWAKQTLPANLQFCALVFGDDNELHLQVNVDIYKEHAKWICDMAFGHARGA